MPHYTHTRQTNHWNDAGCDIRKLEAALMQGTHQELPVLGSFLLLHNAGSLHHLLLQHQHHLWIDDGGRNDGGLVEVVVMVLLVMVVVVVVLLVVVVMVVVWWWHGGDGGVGDGGGGGDYDVTSSIFLEVTRLRARLRVFLRTS